MKRCIPILILLLLLGCTAPDAQQTGVNASPAPVTMTLPAATAEAQPIRPTDAPMEPMPSETPLTVPSEIPSEGLPAVWVGDGAAFGTDLICYVDGIGLCYDFDGWRAADCRLAVEREATQDVPPTETHLVLLTVGGETFCLGELRFDTSLPDRQNFFGQPFDWIVMDSDLADAEPEAVPPAVANASDGETALTGFDYRHIGTIVGFDKSACTIDVLLAEQTESGDGLFTLDADSVSQTPITLTVPENARLTVSDEYPFMPVTRERFFSLLESGYIGFLPAEDEDLFVGCYIGYAGDTLTYLYENFLP